MKYYIDYYSAVHWLNRSLVMINDTIFDIDADYEDPYKEDEDGKPREIFQRFITDFTEDEVEWMGKTFPGVILSYCNTLNKYILCVDHWGTSWDYVWTECELDWVKESKNMGWNEKNEAHYTIARNINTRFMRCK